jgi:MoxR-like ATPase
MQGPTASDEDLRKRPGRGIGGSFLADARRFVAGGALDTAINTAIAVNQPLLITGEPGTGKTQAAYYAAYKLGIEPVLHFQVKSDTTARDLLYHFDNVRYFRDAHLQQDGNLDKQQYVEPRDLWKALTADKPCVLLIDEIDKAPRDFPNDLLHELDKLEFDVPETGQHIQGNDANRPIVFITSNSERRLPEPFLRRCVFHHIAFDRDLAWEAVQARAGDYPGLDSGFLEMAVDRFMRLRARALRKLPATGELLVWLRVLGLKAETYHQKLDDDLAKLPYLGVLLKDHQDLEETRKGSNR